MDDPPLNPPSWGAAIVDAARNPVTYIVFGLGAVPIAEYMIGISIVTSILNYASVLVKAIIIPVVGFVPWYILFPATIAIVVADTIRSTAAARRPPIY